MSDIVNLPNSESYENDELDTQLSTGVHFQGTYSLVTLRVKLKNNSVIEFGSVFNEVEIFEDVFKYSIEGRIRVTDYVGGQEKFLLTGGEQLTIIATKPNGINEILVGRSDLIITKISQVEFNQNNARQYDLFFTSKATVNSMKKKIFKSFGTDRNLSSVIKKLFGEIDSDVQNLSIIDSNIALNAPFVSKGFRPLDAINHLAKRAGVNKDFYLFFERFAKNPGENFTHVFVGLNNLKKFWGNSASIPKIIYEPNVGTINYINAVESEKIVHSYFLRVEPNFDHMINVKTGFYNSRVRTLDLVSRTYTDTKVNYLTDNEMSPNDIYSNKMIDSKNIFTTFDETTIERLITKPTNDPISRKSEWVKYDTLGSVINSGVRVTVQISGGSNKIGIGSLVELSVPSAVSKTLNLESPTVHEDQIYSGKYMVTAVKHVFTPKTYNKTLELSRGSMRFNLDDLINKYLVEDSQTG
jgi:hypothetical protein